MKKQNAGLIALSIVFILMGGFSTIYNLGKYVSNKMFMSSAEKTTGYVKWIDHESKTWGHNKKASNKSETYYITVAVEDCLEQLRILYPDYNFPAVYGG